MEPKTGASFYIYPWYAAIVRSDIDLCDVGHKTGKGDYLTMTSPSAMLVSVGGSPRPIIYSLNRQQPPFIIYFASCESRRLVREEIEPALEFRPQDHQIIVTPDGQDLVASVAQLLEEVPELLRQWEISFDQLRADYTGGTKTMSAAVVLALSGHGSRFSYVGGVERDKAGLGVVLDGREQMLYVQNPWDVLAVESLREIELLFNRCRFASVVERAQEAARATEEKRPLFEALVHAGHAYGLWDGFYYQKALNMMKRAESAFRPLAACSARAKLREFHEALRRDMERLEQLCALSDSLLKSTAPRRDGLDQAADGRELVLDLLANAVRRAEIEHKYDDAVARLYSVIEKIAKLRLKTAWNLDNSAIDPASIPAEAQAVLEGVSKDEQGRMALPLRKSYELLVRLDDAVGRRYEGCAEQLGKILTIRNMSLLAHGWQPISEDTYRKMLNLALTFCDVDHSELPSFPVMNWGREGL